MVNVKTIPLRSGKRCGCSLSIILEDIISGIRQEKGITVEGFLFTDNIVLYVENLKNILRNLNDKRTYKII